MMLAAARNVIVNETGGGLGGLVASYSPANHEGPGLQYVQGVGHQQCSTSFSASDLTVTTLAVLHLCGVFSSPTTTNTETRTKKENIYDEDKNIIGSYYPTERNATAAGLIRICVLQEIYYNTGEGDKFRLNAWYINSNRELAMLSTDYRNDMDFENRQREQTFRGVLSWDRVREKWKVGVKRRLYTHMDGL